MEKFGCFVCPDTGRFHIMYKNCHGTPNKYGSYLRFMSFFSPGNIGQLNVYTSTHTVYSTRQQNAMASSPIEAMYVLEYVKSNFSSE
jgi:hypothetical protein